MRVYIPPSKVAPEGQYCYKITKIVYDEKGCPHIHRRMCPFHVMRDDKPYQMNGYCSYLRLGDWMKNGTSLLFDQVKECDLNSEGNSLDAEDGSSYDK